MSAYDDLLAMLADVAPVVQPTPAPLSALGADPCARLTVAPLAGGMRDAPIVRHIMETVRSKACRAQCGKRCRKDCEKTFVPHHDYHVDGVCTCPPVNVPAWYADQEGLRTKGTPGYVKRIARGGMAGDGSRTFNSTDSTVTRKRMAPRWPIQARTEMALIAAHTSGWIGAQMARMYMEQK